MERVSPAVAVAARHVVAMADLWEGSQGGFQKTGRDLVLSSRRAGLGSLFGCFRQSRRCDYGNRRRRE
ncbi:MAG TPA: hypothetical protein VIR62_04305 [Allosphingosinicella sp.]